MFTPRFEIPEYRDPYYNTRKFSKGYSDCIPGNHYTDGIRTGWDGWDVLPNCVGWSNGRFNEVIEQCTGKAGIKYNFCMDAGARFIRYAKEKGLTVSDVPQLGAIAVWGKGKRGHVGNVERVDAKHEQITISESGWNSRKAFWLAEHSKGQGDWIEGDDATWMRNKGYKFLGFILNPAVTPEEPKNLIFNGKKVAVNMVNIAHSNYIKIRELARLGVADVSYDNTAHLPVIKMK